MVPECHTHYYGDLLRKKLLSKRGKCLDNMLKEISTFHDGLETTGWRHFAPDPCKENEQWVHEFYTNLSIMSFSDPFNMTIKIWEK